MDNPSRRSDHPVIVNGAGPVGLALACELARHGVPHRIFDKTPGPVTESRALAIFPRTLEIFESMGLLEEILAEGQRLNAVSMYSDAKLLAHLKLDRLETPYPFAIALPQSRTERILRARLEALGGRVEPQMELIGIDQDAGSVRARYRRADEVEEIVEGAWLIGCDGAHSAARHLIGMTFQGGQYEEEFLLADVKIESELPDNEAHLFLAKDGLFAYFPFRGGRGRIIATQRAAGEKPELAEVQAMADRRSFHPMKLSDPAWMAWFHISHRMVEHYSKGRVFLAGDAAHIHSPAGGQGMNTGIQDAFNLGWKLALVAHGIAGPHLLSGYEAERMPVARSVVTLTDRMTRMATAHSPAVQHLRDVIVPLLTGITFLKEAMAERMAELSIDYRSSAWVEHHGVAAVHAGDRAPDAVLYDRAERVERRVFELLKTPGFLLLAFEGYNAAEIGQGILKGLPGQAFRVTRPGREIETGTLEDRDHQARIAYQAGDGGLLVLIRPDGYIGFRGQDLEELAEYIQRLKGADRPAAVAV
jgi:2-polyprenyl-6-methoxyphenol hydroxylase-like FAD-dependent oxidoreductase